MKLWLKISCILLGLFFINFAWGSLVAYSNTELEFIIGVILYVVVLFLLLYPIFYYAWKKEYSYFKVEANLSKAGVGE